MTGSVEEDALSVEDYQKVLDKVKADHKRMLYERVKYSDKDVDDLIIFMAKDMKYDVNMLKTALNHWLNSRA